MMWRVRGVDLPIAETASLCRSTSAGVGADRTGHVWISEDDPDLAIDRNERAGWMRQSEPALDGALRPLYAGEVVGNESTSAGRERRRLIGMMARLSIAVYSMSSRPLRSAAMITAGMSAQPVGRVGSG